MLTFLQDDEGAILPLVAAVSLCLTIAAALSTSATPVGTHALRAYLDHQGGAVVTRPAAKVAPVASTPEAPPVQELPRLEELRPPAHSEEIAYDAPESVLVLSAPVPPDRRQAAALLAAAQKPAPVEEPAEDPLPMLLGAGVGLMPSRLKQPDRNARPKLSNALRPAGPSLAALARQRRTAVR